MQEEYLNSCPFCKWRYKREIMAKYIEEGVRLPPHTLAFRGGVMM